MSMKFQAPNNLKSLHISFAYLIFTSVGTPISNPSGRWYAMKAVYAARIHSNVARYRRAAICRAPE
jgi:hypothetical protein